MREWKGSAEKSGVSISKFVVEHVKNSLKQEEGEEGYAPRAELLKKLKEQEAEVAKLTEENRTLRLYSRPEG
ncbi:MAG: hypothetical protein QW057_02075 [Candidatus Bathyarchaeia archaeon]